ncbi:MAG: pilin [bacterium]|nr:pilin [bacterium]
MKRIARQRLIYPVGILLSTATLLVLPELCWAIENPIAAPDFAGVVHAIARFIRSVAIPLTALMVVYAGMLFLVSGGSVNTITRARKALTWALVGFVIILVSEGLTLLVSNVLRGTSGGGPGQAIVADNGDSASDQKTLPGRTQQETTFSTVPDRSEISPETKSPETAVEVIEEDFFVYDGPPVIAAVEEQQEARDRLAGNIFINPEKFNQKQIDALQNEIQYALNALGPDYAKYLVIVSGEEDFQEIWAMAGGKLKETPTGFVITNLVGNITTYLNGVDLVYEDGTLVRPPTGFLVGDRAGDTVIHELAHLKAVDLFGARALDIEWWALSGEAIEKGHVVSEYSKSSSAEHLAEAVVSYVKSGGDPSKYTNDPEKLKSLQEQFAFLKQHGFVR